MYVVRYKTRKRHVPQFRVFRNMAEYGEWQDCQSDIIELVFYADLPIRRTELESCTLARNKGCQIVNGRPVFHREQQPEDMPLIMAWNRRNHR